MYIGRSLALLVSLVASATLYASGVQPGEAAPPLELTNLLQAPAGTKTDWPSLRGKVVVLEFWATWCAPCIANLPHLNELVASVDPHKVVFFAIDDEDPHVVEHFLKKRKVAGWVGLDPTSSVFHRWGIESRPTTVVVDTQGRIAAFTSPEKLNGPELMALAAGKEGAVASTLKPASLEESKPLSEALKKLGGMTDLFAVRLTQAEPNEKFTMSHGKDKLLITGAKPDFLLQYVYGVNSERMLLKNSLPAQTFDFGAQMPSLSSDTATSILQTAVTRGLRLIVQRKTMNQNVFVLQATPRARHLLQPSAATGTMHGIEEGHERMIAASINDLAFDLEQLLHRPVINDTGIAGTYDAQFDLPNNLSEVSAALLKNLALTLAPRSRDIVMLEVSAAPASK